MEHTLAAALARIDLFSELDDETRIKLGERLTRLRLARGESLFREGDASTALYIIERGEVRVLSHDATREIRRLGRGQHIGEMALIDPAPRSATVVARCDTTLWQLSADDFESFAAAHPQLHKRIATTLARRLRDITAREGARNGEAVTLIVDARNAATKDLLLADLQNALETTSKRKVIIVRLDDDPCTPDAVGPRTEDLLDRYGHVLLVFNGIPSNLLLFRAGIDRSDLVLILLSAHSDSLNVARQIQDEIGRLVLAESAVVEYVLDRRTESPRAPFGPIDNVTKGSSVHTIAPTPGYRQTGPPDFGGVGRLARRIARRRVGVAMSGGGSRALAHVGVLAVLERAGIPVDVLAGTSGGAIVAGLAACDWTAENVGEFLLSRWNRRGIVDWKIIPWVSLLRGRKLGRIGRDAARGVTLQELSRPFVPVATDLVTGEEIRLRRGDGWTAVLASLAVPGVFPPVRIDNHYLVDGGALNNLPADAAREAGADIVIGINVSPRLEKAFLQEQSHNGSFPLLRIIYRAISVQGQALQSRQGAADITLTPDVSAYDMFEFTNLKPIIERGRIEAETRIEELRRVARCMP